MQARAYSLGIWIAIQTCICRSLRAVQSVTGILAGKAQRRLLRQSHCGGLSKCFPGRADTGSGATLNADTEAGTTIRLAIRADGNDGKTGVDSVARASYAGRTLGPLTYREGP